MEPSMMLEPVVSLIGDYKSTVFEDGPYPDRGDPKEHNLTEAAIQAPSTRLGKVDQGRLVPK